MGISTSRASKRNRCSCSEYYVVNQLGIPRFDRLLVSSKTAMEMIALYVIVLIYLLVLFCFIYGIRNTSKKGSSKTGGISVIIPFRNEQKELNALLDSIEKMLVPACPVEFLFVSDYASENAKQIIQNHQSKWSVRMLGNKGVKGKKTALSTGVKQAKFEWIYTTDADCIIPSNLFHVFSKNSPEADLIAGPVLSLKTESFQAMNLASLSAFSAASSYWGILTSISGANLFYKKQCFLETNPYRDNVHIPSGDDVFLLKKFRERKLQVSYWASSQNRVKTHEKETLKSFMRQQRRWSSKTASLKSTSNSLIALLIWTANLSIILSLFLLPWHTSIGIWILKITVDALYFKSFYSVIGEPFPLRTYWKHAITYPFFVSVLGWISLKRKKNWD